MNRPGTLLDTGPLVALLSRDDTNHQQAKRLFTECEPPFRTCEAVIAEACFLMRKVSRFGPAEVMALGPKGIYEISISVDDHWAFIESLLRKYSNRPVSLTDACLIRCAELYEEPRIATFDSDFDIYRWKGKKRFDVL